MKILKRMVFEVVVLSLNRLTVCTVGLSVWACGGGGQATASEGQSGRAAAVGHLSFVSDAGSGTFASGI